MDAIYSKSIKAGKSTYFIDVKEAKNGNKYLSICESRFNGEERKRSYLNVFGENVEKFREAIDEAAGVCSAG